MSGGHLITISASKRAADGPEDKQLMKSPQVQGPSIIRTEGRKSLLRPVVDMGQGRMLKIRMNIDDR